MPKLTEVFNDNPRSSAEKRVPVQKIKRIHYSKIVESKYQYRERTREVIIALADLIKADGKILQPCSVRKIGGDTYELIAGHKRWLASIYLAEEEGLEQYALIPCIEEDMTDVRTEFAVYSSNGYDEKTPYEIMREIEGMSKLLTEHPEEFPEFAGKGRLVEKLAAQLQMSRSVVSDYKNISHNLGEKGMEAFRSGELDKSAAVTLASMPEEKQEEILAKGLTKREDIKGYVKTKQSEPKLPTPQQMRLFAIHAKDYLQKVDVSDWADVLRYHHKNAYYGGQSLRYQGSYRGLTINDCDEITWHSVSKMLQEHCSDMICVKKEHTVTSSADTEVKEYVNKVDQSPKRCTTGWSTYGVCSCCGHNGVSCCKDCSESCNGRCGWIPDHDKDEQLEGQMSVADYPDVVPENMLQESMAKSVSNMDAESDTISQVKKDLLGVTSDMDKAVLEENWKIVLTCADEIRRIAKAMLDR